MSHDMAPVSRLGVPMPQAALAVAHMQPGARQRRGLRQQFARQAVEVRTVNGVQAADCSR